MFICDVIMYNGFNILERGLAIPLRALRDDYIKSLGNQLF